MAITNGFFPSRKPLDLQMRRAFLANVVGSSTLVMGIGSALQTGAASGAHTGYVTLSNGTAANFVLGVVTALVYQGKVTELTSFTGVNATGTSAASGTANETSKDWAVDYIPAFLPITWNGTMGAAAETTAGSSGQGFLGISTGVTGAGTLLESSYVIFSGTQTQFWSFGTATPGSTTQTAVTGHWSQGV